MNKKVVIQNFIIELTGDKYFSMTFGMLQGFGYDFVQILASFFGTFLSKRGPLTFSISLTKLGLAYKWR